MESEGVEFERGKFGRFDNRQRLVETHVAEFLDRAGGPLDFHDVRNGGVAQPEMRQQARLSKTRSSGNFPQLPQVRCSDCRMYANFCADTRPVRCRADTLQLQPVI